MANKMLSKPLKQLPEHIDDWVNRREKEQRLSVDLPISLHKALKVVAAESGKTMAEIVREAIEERVKKEK